MSVVVESVRPWNVGTDGPKPGRPARAPLRKMYIGDEAYHGTTSGGEHGAEDWAVEMMSAEVPGMTTRLDYDFGRGEVEAHWLPVRRIPNAARLADRAAKRAAREAEESARQSARAEARAFLKSNAVFKKAHQGTALSASEQTIFNRITARALALLFTQDPD